MAETHTTPVSELQLRGHQSSMSQSSSSTSENESTGEIKSTRKRLLYYHLIIFSTMPPLSLCRLQVPVCKQKSSLM